MTDVARSTTKLILLSILLAIMCSACQRPKANARPSDPPFERRDLTVNGLKRSFTFWVPSSVGVSRPAPLVLLLHGGGGKPAHMCRTDSGVASLAADAGFIVACPAGVDGHWNDGRSMEEYRAQREGIDDVAFLKAVVEAVGEEAPVDRRRVYVSGLSNGGMMTLRLACEAGDTFAAAAAVIANMPADLDCRPAAPVPVMIMNGTDDPLMPWDGGQVHFFRRQLGAVLSTESTADGCSPDPVGKLLPDTDPGDGTRVERQTYSACDDGAEVVLVTVRGGGHTLPGGDQYLPVFLVGRVSHDLDGAQAIWSFLSSHALP